ncbi:hypothetical protein [Buttiauxella agrestis]|uniref:Lipoprotein n=1 Tax=Buttiauxella agrestis ATCC 33320 TaxID=1006004 RepID=A0A085GEG3_9ENTR|nr:hypothetical protein [Buttiauxella agrestis]KFC82108.1 hypothetical protein GBAG_1824 [Buttiauxella agrestis ATCC 33320]
MNIHKAFLVLIVIGTAACTTPVEYIPESKTLKPATVGMPYFFRIKILGGGVMKHDTPGATAPSNMGISLRNCQLPESKIKNMLPKDSNDYNCIEIYGIPTKSGVIEIKLWGGMYGSMIARATRFKKEYTLNVTQP